MRAMPLASFVIGAVAAAGCAIAAVLTGQMTLFFLPAAIVALLVAMHRPHLLFYALIASIPWSIEYNFTPSLGTDLPDEPLMLLTSFSIVLFLVASRKKEWLRPLWSPLGLLLALQFGWMLLTVVNSTLPLVSVKYALAKCWYLAAFIVAPVVFFREKRHVRNTARILAMSMMAFTLTGLIRHAGYGFTFSKINDSLYPFFRNHVNYSALLVCVIPLLALHYREARPGARKHWALVLLGVALGALFLSYARGAWLALITGGLAYLVLRRRWLLRTYVIVLVAVTLGVFALVRNDKYLAFAHDYNSTIFHTNFEDHLVATYQFKDVSTAERFYRWVAGVRMVKDRWETGFGPNTFYQHYQGYAVPAFKTWVSKNEEHSTVHNYFLLTLIEQGVIGLILLLVMLGCFFATVQRLYATLPDPFWKNAIAAVTVVMVMLCTVNFLSDLVETDKLGSLFYLCLAVVMGRTRSYDPRS
jgi:O-antigen ligase